MAQLVADELGITAGLECFTTGDLGACGETALNVALMFVGGLPAKLAAKYGLRWGKAAELGRRISALSGELIDGIQGLNRANKKLENIPPPPPRSGPSCVDNSFGPETRVVMADGSPKPIEDVDIGEKVLATDPETGEQSARTVLATIVGSGAKALVQITIDPTSERDASEGDEAGSEESEGVPGPVAAGDVIVATDAHPFWVPDLGLWVDAIDLAPGMWLQTSSGTWVQVSAIQAWTATATVHNLTVQGVHTYHVAAGGLDVLNHNSNCDPVKAVRAEADAVADRSNSKRPGVIEALNIPGESTIIGYSDGGSGSRRVHPEVQGVLSSIGESSRGANHGGCGLVECLTVALDSGLDPHGASAAAALGRKRDHKDFQKLIGPCNSCQVLVGHYGIDFRR